MFTTKILQYTYYICKQISPREFSVGAFLISIGKILTSYMDSYTIYRSPSHQNSRISATDAHSSCFGISHRRMALSIALMAAIV